MRLQAGDKAPEFELPDADGKIWSLTELEGNKVVVYFYPADDTPGCSIEACDFRDSQPNFDKAGYTVLGISPQGAESHRKFMSKYELNFPLLIDEDRAVADSYGAFGDRTLYGKVTKGIIRSTFVIDENGVIEHAQYGVKAKGHVGRLREALALE